MKKLDIGEFILSRKKGNYSIHMVVGSRFVIIINRDTNSVEECIRIEDSVMAHIDEPNSFFLKIQSVPEIKIDLSKIGTCSGSSIVSVTFKNEDQSITEINAPNNIDTNDGHKVTIVPSDMIYPYYNNSGLNTILGSIVQKDGNGKPILGITLHANTDYLNRMVCDYGTNYGNDYEKFYTDFGIIAESKYNNNIHFIPTN